MVENHHDWVATVPDSPDIIAMTFVPINALLNGVAGSGFLSHAVNLYLRCMFPVLRKFFFNLDANACCISGVEKGLVFLLVCRW